MSTTTTAASITDNNDKDTSSTENPVSTDISSVNTSAAAAHPQPDAPNGHSPGTTTTTTTAMEKEIIRRTRDKPRDDGGVLNCFSVSVYCFKLGRLTVPPVSRVESSLGLGFDVLRRGGV